MTTDTESTAVPYDPAELTKALRKCTPKQRLWLRAIDRHKYQPWGTADALGLSHHTIHRWLRDPTVRRARDLICERGIDELAVDNRTILETYVRLARSMITDFYNEDSTIKPIKDWTPAMAAAVVEFTKDAAGNVKLRLHEKRSSNDALAKYLKLIVERHEVTGKDGAPLPMTPVCTVVISK